MVQIPRTGRCSEPTHRREDRAKTSSTRWNSSTNLKGNDSNVVSTIFDGIQEVSKRKIAEEVRKFIQVYNKVTVGICDPQVEETLSDNEKYPEVRTEE